MDSSKKYGKLSVKFLASALSVVTLFPAVTPCANAVNSKEVKSVNSVIMKMKNVEEYAKELAKKGYKKISTLVENYPKTVTAIATTLVLSAIVSVVFVCYKSHRDRREHGRIRRINTDLYIAKTHIVEQQRDIDEQRQIIARQQGDIDEQQQRIASQQRDIDEQQQRIASQQRDIDEQRQIIARQQGDIDEQQQRIVSQQRDIDEQRQIIVRQQGDIDEQQQLITELRQRINGRGLYNIMRRRLDRG